jgi:cation diffusion facilitator CzcD-associated flavoprotein CzcO
MSDFDVAIIGTGFSGLGMAINLKKAGRDDFVVLERAEDVGGTWHFNTYPGCGCDVPSHLYSFSFAPNPDWSETYSKQPEIRSYLEKVATDFGVRPHIRFKHTVKSAAWDEDAEQWVIDTDQGEVRARVLVSGQGPLTEPKIPDLPGLDEFEGETFHSARWNHDYDLEGKKVASIGTGASAIQYVPAIQPDVEKLTVFQRTPPWIFPHSGRKISDLEKTLYRRVPFLQKLNRAGVYAMREQAVLGFVKEPRIMKAVEKLAIAHMKKGIARKPELFKKVKPNYTIGCKRILPSNHWYPALAKPNVDLVTGGVERVTKDGVIGPDGVEHKVDTIIFGTGFEVTDVPVAKHLRGRGGKTLDEVWNGSMNALYGTAMNGFPNLFLLLGPNTGLGHSSMVYMAESQIAHVMRALDEMDKNGASTIEARADVTVEYNRELDRKLDKTVWNTGCASWYLDDTGRNATLWPDFTFAFRRRVTDFDNAGYELRSKPPVAREAVTA